MELKTARLTLLIDPNKKAAFEQLCARQDRTPSQVVRQLIRDYLSQHDVNYVGSGSGSDAPAASVTPVRPPRRAAPAERSAPEPSPPPTPTRGKRRQG